MRDTLRSKHPTYSAGMAGDVRVERVPLDRQQFTVLADGLEGVNGWIEGIANLAVPKVALCVNGNPHQGKNGNYWYRVVIDCDTAIKLGELAKRQKSEHAERQYRFAQGEGRRGKAQT